MNPAITGLLLMGVVDRIEGSWVVIEWSPTAELRDVARTAVPQHVTEGTRLYLDVRAHEQGTALAIGHQDHQVLVTTAGRIHLPSDAQLSGTSRYTVQFLKTHHAHPGASIPQRALTSKETRTLARNGMDAPTQGQPRQPGCGLEVEPSSGKTRMTACRQAGSP